MIRTIVTYHVRGEAAAIDARAAAIAVEQSVEMPIEAITDAGVLDDIVGEVQSIRDLGAGLFEVRIGLATVTMGADAGQLMNMLFGNASIYDDVTLVDADIPAELAAVFGGPYHGIHGLRRGVSGRALTCAALKPQGLGPDDLAAIAGKLARGGLDYIKDDHGLADQAYSPFKDRVKACTSSINAANAATGFQTRYAPNVSGNLDAMRMQLRIAADEGIDTVLIEPMIAGVSNFNRITRDFPGIAFLAHPAMAGAARIAPSLLLGKLFRLFGADATIYPNYGGRFSYSPDTCRAIANAAREPFHDLRSCVPTPAGGMTLARVPELLDFYGPDTMLLIGGNLLAAKDRMTDEASAFTARVAAHFKERSHG